MCSQCAARGRVPAEPRDRPGHATDFDRIRAGRVAVQVPLHHTLYDGGASKERKGHIEWKVLDIFAPAELAVKVHHLCLGGDAETAVIERREPVVSVIRRATIAQICQGVEFLHKKERIPTDRPSLILSKNSSSRRRRIDSQISSKHACARKFRPLIAKPNAKAFFRGYFLQ